MNSKGFAHFFKGARVAGHGRLCAHVLARVLGVVLATVMIAAASLAVAQNPGNSRDGKRRNAAKLPNPAVALADLLDDDVSNWLEALNVLRAKPERSRRVMMLAVQQDLKSPNRWRIFHHISEFGRAEDIPLLLQRIDTASTPLEKLTLEGSARALYPAAYQGEDLSFVVEVFSFAQTKPPETLDGRHTNKLVMSRDVYANYHREGLPIDVIKRLLPLKGRAYGGSESLQRAISRLLRKKQWEAHRELLLAPIEPVPEWMAQEGLLRFSMRNPLDRPLLLKVAFNAWGSRFDPEVAPRYVYLAPEATKQVDIPVRVVKSRETAAARVGMRLWEVNGPFVPIFQKLYITF